MAFSNYSTVEAMGTSDVVLVPLLSTHSTLIVILCNVYNLQRS